LVNVSASVVPSKKPVVEADEAINMISTTEREDDLLKREYLSSSLHNS
jgi:hypothetical protein